MSHKFKVGDRVGVLIASIDHEFKHKIATISHIEPSSITKEDKYFLTLDNKKCKTYWTVGENTFVPINTIQDEINFLIRIDLGEETYSAIETTLKNEI